MVKGSRQPEIRDFGVVRAEEANSLPDEPTPLPPYLGGA
jgi:hypothetical protein